jgi:DNA replication protein DnaC
MNLKEKTFIHDVNYWMNECQKNCQDCDMFATCEQALKEHKLDKSHGFYIDDEGYSLELECRKRANSAVILEEGDFPLIYALEKRIPNSVKPLISDYVQNVQNQVQKNNLFISGTKDTTLMRLACSAVNNLHLTKNINVNFVTANQISSYARSADEHRITLEKLISYSDILVITNIGQESGLELDMRKIAHGEYKQSQIILNDIIARRAYNYTKSTILVVPPLKRGERQFEDIYMPSTVELINSLFIKVKI